MWDLSSPIRDQTSSPVLKGEDLITGPPGTSPYIYIYMYILMFVTEKENSPGCAEISIEKKYN